MRVIAGSLLLLATAAWAIGCGTTVVMPTHPADPVTVYLLDHGHTSSLVLPSGGGWVRYAYGDWNYYALGNDGFLDAIAALSWPTRGTLGRKEYGGSMDEAGALGGVEVGSEEVHRIRVAREAVARTKGSTASTSV